MSQGLQRWELRQYLTPPDPDEHQPNEKERLDAALAVWRAYNERRRIERAAIAFDRATAHERLTTAEKSLDVARNELRAMTQRFQESQLELHTVRTALMVARIPWWSRFWGWAARRTARLARAGSEQ